MAFSLVDSYEVSGDGYLYPTASTTWLAQTFITTKEYDITRIGLYLNRPDDTDIGTITVSIRTVSGGDPDGEDLTSGTLSSADIAQGGGWVYFDVTAYTLSNATSYAIVLRADAIGSGDRMGWYYDSANGYADGARNTSTNSGGTWGGPYTGDAYFRTYEEGVTYEDAIGTVGIASAVTGTSNVSFGAIGAVAIALALTGTATTAFNATGTVAIVSALTAKAVRVMLRDPMKGVWRLVACGNDELWYEDL